MVKNFLTALAFSKVSDSDSNTDLNSPDFFFRFPAWFLHIATITVLCGSG